MQAAFFNVDVHRPDGAEDELNLGHRIFPGRVVQ